MKFLACNQKRCYDTQLLSSMLLTYLYLLERVGDRVIIGLHIIIGCLLDETQVFPGDHPQITNMMCLICSFKCNLLEIKVPTYLPT